MENYVFDNEPHKKGEKSDEDFESPEEGFMEGYAEDEEVDECAECGSAIDGENKIIKEIEGETYKFCSENCAKEFEDGLS